MRSCTFVALGLLQSVLLLASFQPTVLVTATLPFSTDLTSEASPCSVSARHVSPSSAASSAPSLNVQLDAWGDDSIRIRISPDAVIVPPVQALHSFAPPLSSESPCRRVASDAHSNSALINGNLAVSVAADGSISAVRVSDGLSLIQTAPPSFTLYTMPAAYSSLYSVYAVSIDYRHAAGFVYGLGEHQYPADRTVLPYTNFSYLFEQSQQYTHSRGGAIFMPWYLSQRGYGVLMNEAGYGSIVINNNTAAWSFNATHQLDIFITTTSATSTASTPYAELMERFSAATGRTNPLPHWASGFWQSKDRYRSQAEILGVAEGLHNRSLATSVIVIDYMHWDQFGDWTFTTACWPDPAAMVEEARSYGMRTMVSIWPVVVPASTHFQTMNTSDYLTKGADGQIIQPVGSGIYLIESVAQPTEHTLWSIVLRLPISH